MLADYVQTFAERGACTCKRCIDAPENPKEKQPGGHTINLIFFSLKAKDGVDKKVFEKMAKEEYPQWFDGNEHSYLQVGGEMGDQGIALMTIGLGHLLNVWDALTPDTIPFLSDELKKQMAGLGYVSLKTRILKKSVRLNDRMTVCG